MNIPIQDNETSTIVYLSLFAIAAQEIEIKEVNNHAFSVN